MNNRTINRPHSQTDARRRPSGASIYRPSTRPELIADGVIAGYIHDISARHVSSSQPTATTRGLAPCRERRRGSD